MSRAAGLAVCKRLWFDTINADRRAQHWRGKQDVQRVHQANFDQLFKGRTCKLEVI
jgi:hypothetical protein